MSHFKICKMSSRNTEKRENDMGILKITICIVSGVGGGSRAEGGIHHCTSVHFKVCQLPSRSTGKREKDMRMLELRTADPICAQEGIGVQCGNRTTTLSTTVQSSTGKQTGEIV